MKKIKIVSISIFCIKYIRSRIELRKRLKLSMAKSIDEILSNLDKTRTEKKENLKKEESDYYDVKEKIRQNYLKLLWDKDLNRPLTNLNKEIYKGSNKGGRNRSRDSGVSFIGSYIVVENITPIGDIDGSNRFFVLPQFPIIGSEHIILNGLLQDEDDYTINGNVIEFYLSPNLGEIIQVSYLVAI